MLFKWVLGGIVFHCLMIIIHHIPGLRGHLEQSPTCQELQDTCFILTHDGLR